MTSSSRRDFLKVAGAGAAAGLAASCSPIGAQPAQPPMPVATAVPAAAMPPPVSSVPPVTPVVPVDKRVLVVVQLSGGHDGLNAVVPYGNGLYYQLRPQIGIAADQVLHLDEQIGLHPNLKSFKALYDNRQLAIIQGVGYPNPSRSHFRSMEIWHSAQPEGAPASQGWLGAFMAQVYKVGESPFQCVNFGSSVPQALQTQHAPVAALQDTTSFQFLVDRRLPTLKDPLLKTFGQMYGKPAQKTPALELVASNWDSTARGVNVLSGSTEKYQAAAQYPNNGFGKTLQQIASMIAADVGTRVFYVQLGGFDTHANEKPAHATLLSQLADGLAAFQTDLEGHGRAEQVLTMSFSEFGRRVKENGSQGTDHGAAGPMFVLGKGVRGGLYGDHPDLARLDEGDLSHTVDFRSVYATVIEDWLGAPAHDVLAGSFDRLGFVA
ncbi:MAG TPA: DUF1501 domain-containing protein [Chloroflexota bacterium]|jgi:uncharacterized protein (DUF1501 family)|nr:DUF1501 domain-containing protein [Chloroflexota bacterium]